MTRRFFSARPAGKAPGRKIDIAIKLPKLAAERPPCPPAGAPNLWPLLDTFTDADGMPLEHHVSDSGHVWSPLLYFRSDPPLRILGNMAVGGGWHDTHFYPSVIPPGAEYDITATLVMPQAIPVNANQAGIMARHDPIGTNGYFLEFRGSATAPTLDVELWQIVSYVWTSLGNFQYAAVDENQAFEIIFQCRDAAKKVFLDGGEIISSADNIITDKGRITMFMASDAGEFRFDRFAADSP